LVQLFALQHTQIIEDIFFKKGKGEKKNRNCLLVSAIVYAFDVPSSIKVILASFMRTSEN